MTRGKWEGMDEDWDEDVEEERGVGGGQRGESRQKSDTGRRVRGPYSFRQELSGGMRVRER